MIHLKTKLAGILVLFCFLSLKCYYKDTLRDRKVHKPNIQFKSSFWLLVASEISGTLTALPVFFLVASLIRSSPLCLWQDVSCLVFLLSFFLGRGVRGDTDNRILRSCFCILTWRQIREMLYIFKNYSMVNLVSLLSIFQRSKGLNFGVIQICSFYEQIFPPCWRQTLGLTHTRQKALFVPHEARRLPFSAVPLYLFEDEHVWVYLQVLYSALDLAVFLCMTPHYTVWVTTALQ